MSLAGTSFTQSQARALEAAFFNDVLPVAAAGNHGDSGNPLEFPAALVGGRAGRRGIGLSVGATMPNGAAAAFSTHNKFVSLAAPGRERRRLPLRRVLDAAGHDPTPGPPRTAATRRSPASGRALRLRRGHELRRPDRVGARRARVAGRAAARLRAGRRGAHELGRRRGWNQFTGAGVADGMRAVEIARVYDVVPPRARTARVHRHGNRVRVHVNRTRDRTARGHELAGHAEFGLLVSRDGGRQLPHPREPPEPSVHEGRADPRPARQRAREHRLRRERQLRRQAARPLPPARADRVYR